MAEASGMPINALLGSTVVPMNTAFCPGVSLNFRLMARHTPVQTR